MPKKSERVVNHDLVQRIIDEQIGNLTQRHFETNGAYRDIKTTLESFCKRVAHLTMVHAGARPAIGHQGWKEEIGNLSYELANGDESVKRLIEETQVELRKQFPKAILPHYHYDSEHSMIGYSLWKLAMTAANVAVMVIHDYDPDWLRLTNQEANQALREHAARLAKKGTRTLVVDPSTLQSVSIPHMGSPSTN